ncbi:hypothetical protein DPMN_163031 [Dreissena polymorpha]|uniref:Uncharacterized protein n=1 Tax=Dreissena polymorpha TaxID=45954 RepID=A0A9D4ESR7_DREPO|nr:hypothetical protein DPMN_163031 [Dreissena polymorpha]
MASIQTFYIFQLFTHRRLNLSALVSKNADQPWDVELTDDRRRRFKKRNIAEKVNGTCKQVDSRTELSNAESQRRRRFKKRNIAEKVNGTCKQVPTVNKDFSCCETTQQKCSLLLDVSGLLPGEQ